MESEHRSWSRAAAGNGSKVVAHQYAKTPETGGELALTDRRLIFTPWRFTALSQMFAAGFLPVPADPYLSEAVQQLQSKSGTLMIELDRIESASIGRRASLYRAPALVVTTTSATVAFGILVGPYKRNRSPANTRARDAFVAALNASLRPTH
jgi:hypothetical protein